jgi:uncharacterized protein (TIGR02117 family)
VGATRQVMQIILHKHRSSLIASAVATVTCALLSLGGCAYFKDWRHLPTSKSDEVTIYVVSHGWHTGIVVPRNQLGEHLAFVPKQLGEYPFYEFGWGEKDFYQAPENTVLLALKASLWVNESTMHVATLPLTPDQYFPASETVTLHVSTNGLHKLTTALAASFATDAQDKAIYTSNGLYGERSGFFDGVGSYHFFNTCNTWTARMLNTAGVPTTTVLTLSAGSVIKQSKRAAEKYQCCAQPL